MNALVGLAIFVGIIFLIGNVLETRAHKSPKEPLEDLRVAYAPNLLQVLKDQVEQEQREKEEHKAADKRRREEGWDRYKRALEDAKIKRLLEGNPVTDENPLTKREKPIPPSNPYNSLYY